MTDAARKSMSSIQRLEEDNASSVVALQYRGIARAGKAVKDFASGGKRKKTKKKKEFKFVLNYFQRGF